MIPKLTRADATAIRRRFSSMVREMSTKQACRQFCDKYGVSSTYIWDIITHKTFRDPDYNPRPRQKRCPNCKLDRPTFWFYYGSDRRKHETCRRCHEIILSLKEKRVVRNRYREDPHEAEKYWCQTCGIGVDQKGKPFASQAEADQCCADVVTNPRRYAAVPTPGKYAARGRFVTASDYV